MGYKGAFVTMGKHNTLRINMIFLKKDFVFDLNTRRRKKMRTRSNISFLKKEAIILRLWIFISGKSREPSGIDAELRNQPAKRYWLKLCMLESERRSLRAAETLSMNSHNTDAGATEKSRLETRAAEFKSSQRDIGREGGEGSGPARSECMASIGRPWTKGRSWQNVTLCIALQQNRKTKRCWWRKMTKRRRDEMPA